MAHLFRPVSVKPIPPHAERCKSAGKPAVRWKGRDGSWIVGTIDADGIRCRVKSPYWWVEWRDARGVRHRERVSKLRPVAEHRMGEIVHDVERARGNLAPIYSTAATLPLTALALEYRDHLRAMGRSPKHYTQTHVQIVRVASDCKWVRAQDVTLAGWVRWVGEQRTADADGSPGLAAETVNHYHRALRGFFRWLIRSNKAQVDPLAAAEALNADADRRLTRRTLDAPEFRRLIVATRNSQKRRLGIDGPGRAALYLLAATTGLRAGELAPLKASDLRIDAPIPFLVATAKRAKSRKAADIPIPAATVAELRTWIGQQFEAPLLWPGNWHRHDWGADMLARDLRAAGIEPVTPDGQYDFHALRSQYGTDLARAGVPIQVAQQLLRHSTPALTAKHYTRLHLSDLADAANRLGGER